MAEKKNKGGSFQKVKVKISSKHPLAKVNILPRTTEDSKQVKTTLNNPTGEVTPGIPFDLLRKTVNTSSILSGIINKIASSCDTGFKPTGNEDLDKLLTRMDVHEAIRNFSIFWNVFFEKLKSNWQSLIDLDIILTETVKIKETTWEDWAATIALLQRYWTQTAEWNEWEYIHIKRGSLTSKYYGDTIFMDCIESILILFHIEQVYRKLFENGFIEPVLLVDEDSSLTQPQKDAITTFIKDYFRGIDNGFELWIISGKVKRLELTNKIDHNSFIALKKEIKEDISIALSIPFELLAWKNANRATRDSSFEDFNLTTILPLQQRFVRQLRKWLEQDFPQHASLIELNPVDVTNQAEVSKVIDTYIRCGVYSIDQAMEAAWLDPTGLPENQVRKVYGSGATPWVQDPNTPNPADPMVKIEDQVKKIYIKKWKS